MLKILLNFCLNTYYKHGGLSKILTKKGFKLVLSRGNDIIVSNLSFMLLLAEVDLILKEQSCKKDIFITYNTSHGKIILALPAKVIVFYI